MENLALYGCYVTFRYSLTKQFASGSFPNYRQHYFCITREKALPDFHIVFSACNTKLYRTIFFTFYNILQPNLAIV